MNLHLKDKIILITGGAGSEGSIGQTMVYALAEEGAIPIILDRNERGFAYEKELQSITSDALFVQTDLSKPDQIKQAFETLNKKFSTIDVVINNVGVNDGAGLHASVDDFIASLHLNLISYFTTVKYALPMLKKSKGTILNIGSKVAVTGQGNTSGYAAAKGGVLGLTREWAVDLLPFNIRCNALIIAESMTPAYENWLETLENGAEKRKAIEQNIPLNQRMTTPQEIANTALFLISEQSSHTTGQYIFVDGGYVHLDRALLSK